MGDAERIPRAALRLVALQDLDRLPRPLERLIHATELCRPARLRRPQDAELGRLAAELEQPLGPLEMRPRLLALSFLDEHPGAGQMGVRELDRVLGRLEESDRAPQVRERPVEVPLLGGRAGERPVEPDSAAGVPDRFQPLSGLEKRDSRAGRFTALLERLAQVRLVEGGARLVARGPLRQLLDAALEERHRPLGHPELAVGAGERPVDVRAELGHRRLGVERPLELGHGSARLTERGERDPAPGARPRLDVRVAALASVVEKGAEALLRRAEVGAQAQLELRVRQAKLAVLSLGDRRTGLQVLE